MIIELLSFIIWRSIKMVVSKLIFFAIWVSTVLAHIPMNEMNLAEPDGITYGVTSDATLSRAQSLVRLAAMRNVMEQYGVHAYIIPTADAHGSQYLAPTDARREWVSGLSGSSGTALVTTNAALLWTDARYWTQFDTQVNREYWTLMRQGIDASLQTWLSQNMGPDTVVAVDPTTYTRSAWTTLELALKPSNVTLRSIPENLVDLARAAIGDPAPQRPNNALSAHTIEFSGQRADEKIKDLVNKIEARGAAILILTALDDIAYTLNIRGTDIPFNPVFFSYLIVRADRPSPNNVILFWGNGLLSSDIQTYLSTEGISIQVLPYSHIFTYLASLSNELSLGSTIWLTDGTSHAVFLAAETNPNVNIISTISPVALVKCFKNEVELAGFRSAHIKDGTAVVRFLRWVHEQVHGGHSVTEVHVADKLEEFRAQELHFMGPSFATIAGAGENGAIIHYKPERDGPQRVITKDDMLLVDSGGQYRDGTTDMTRTRHMSTPTEAQRRAFTRVLKGQIMMGTAVFPREIVGHRLETLARKALWDVGLNYGHGTGHGVGHFLNVHEGPSWILSGPSPTDPGIQPGMIFSNEPGYYEVNEYGIRHEDLVEVILLNTTSDHIQASGLVGDFDGAGALGFHTISLAPHQTSCLDVDLLTDFELKYLNDYHARVFKTLGPILQSRGLNEDYLWLEKECAPIQRSAAIATTLAPILAVVSVMSVWF